MGLGATIRLAATGQTIRTGIRRTDTGSYAGRYFYVGPGRLVHLTDGVPNSRTGYNVRTLCAAGAGARPERLDVDVADVKVCRKCDAAAPVGYKLEARP